MNLDGLALDPSLEMMAYDGKTWCHRVTHDDILTLTSHEKAIGRSDRVLDKTIARYGSPGQFWPALSLTGARK